MKDSTKIKLINSLIDMVARFYDQKSTISGSKAEYIKGFSEGIAYSLVQMDILDTGEAKDILKGLGKKRKVPTTEDLDIPTVFRQNKKKVLEIK